MKYRIMSITRSVIPYVKELNPITGGMVGSVLMQQIEFWMERYPNGFYKFMAPSPDHPHYRPGSSWVEELGISDNEFRTAFDQIGTRFKSKTEYDNATDKFKGKLYCSYVDRRANLTYYIRNDDLVDAKLEALILWQQDRADGLQVPDIQAPLKVASREIRKVDLQGADRADSQQIGKPNSQQSRDPQVGNRGTPAPGDQQDPLAQQGNTQIEEFALPVSGNSQSMSQEVQKVGDHITETTAHITKQQPQTTCDQSHPGSGSGQTGNLVFPAGLHDRELAKIKNIILLCPVVKRQDVLDEVEGIRRMGGIKRGIIPLTEGLVRRVAAGDFTLSLGVTVQSEREAAARLQLESAKAPVVVMAGGHKESVSYATLTEEALQALPPNIRERARLARDQALATA